MKHSAEEVQKFMGNLYKNSDSKLKELFKHQYTMKSDIEKEIANIMYIYAIQRDLMNMTYAEQQKEIKKLDKLIDEFYKADAEMQISILYKLLEGTTKETFRFFNYNADKKEITKIVRQSYEGRHFSANIWANEAETAKYMKNQLFDFIKGKVNVNQITTNITKLFNNSHYEARRLAETEVARCQSAAFDRFGEEVGIKKVKYNATLCNTCDKCKADDGELFDFKNKPKLPRHPFCQCYYDIADDVYDNTTNKINEIFEDDESNKIINKYGKEVEFQLEGMKEEKQQKIKKILSDLSKEYNTSLNIVYKGSGHAAGKVDVAYNMYLNSSKIEDVTHEFAHSLAVTNSDKFKLTDNKEFWKEIRKIRREYMKACEIDSKKVISSYSKQDMDEFMAEAFTHARLREKASQNYGNDYEFSDRVLEVINKYFKKN